MNEFDKRVAELTDDGLTRTGVDVLQVNLGRRCNQACRHCHLEASRRSDEMMDWPTMEKVIAAARRLAPELVDITGGAPELNPYYRRFISSLRDEGFTVQSRTNLTVLTEPDMEDLPGLFKYLRLRLVGSLPCYTRENVKAQRGEGSFDRSIEAMRKLNSHGFGVEPRLTLNLVYNPGGPFLPGDQASLEADYRRELKQGFGVSFTSLITITNMPIGRFGASIREAGKEAEYIELLKHSFNPDTVEHLMCRRQISVGFDGSVYDCDFNLALGLNADGGRGISDLDPDSLRGEKIATGAHCFGCTAGSGSSCAGALV